MLDFLVRLGSVTTELNRLLGMRFVPGHSCNNTPIGRAIASLIPLRNSGNLFESNFELLRLAFLVKHLKEIEQSDSRLLQHFRREFRRAGNSDSYYGVRFEAYVAANLVRNKIPFKKSEAPDFLIRGDSLGIECTSVRIRSLPRKSDYGYKILSAVKKKVESGSHKPEAALFIDVTNIAYNSSAIDTGYLRRTATDAIQTCSFGAIVLFVYMFNHGLQRIEANYIRVDSSHILSSLNELLNRLCPIEGHEVSSYSIPHEG